MPAMMLNIFIIIIIIIIILFCYFRVKLCIGSEVHQQEESLTSCQ